MKLFVRNSLSGEYYAGTGSWTPNPGLAHAFSSAEAALAQFPATLPMLELVVRSEVTSSMIAIPLMAMRIPTAGPGIPDNKARPTCAPPHAEAS